MAIERINITQPPDWVEAFQKAAEKRGWNLSRWLGEAGKKQLPKEVRDELSERIPQGRPKK